MGMLHPFHPVINVSLLMLGIWAFSRGFFLDIIIAKTCCGQGYKAALRLKCYLESKKHTCNIYGKKWQNVFKLLNEYGVIFNEKEKQAWIIVKELGICIREKEVDEWITRDKTNG